MKAIVAFEIDVVGQEWEGCGACQYLGKMGVPDQTGKEYCWCRLVNTVIHNRLRSKYCVEAELLAHRSETVGGSGGKNGE